MIIKDFKITKKTSLIKSIIIFITVILFFFIISFIINKIPADYIIAAGDFHQEVNFEKGITDYFYNWNDSGYGYSNIQPHIFLFYLFQLILFKLGLDYAQIANSIMFIFLTCSFFSFYFSIKIFDKENKLNNLNIALISTIYSLNNFTLSVFTYSWGYTSFFLIYIFAPLLFVFFIKIFKNYDYKYFYGFLLVFFFSAVSYANAGFFAALLVFETLLLIVFFITRYVKFNKQNIINYFVLLFLQIMLISYFFIPYFVANLSYYSSVVDSNVLGNYMDWISRTSYNIFNTLLFSINDNSYPIFNPVFNNTISIIFSSAYFVFLILLVCFQQKKKEKIGASYMIFFVLFFILLLRLNKPFDLINQFIYRIPGFSFFRSPDKFFAFLPLFFLLTVTVLLITSKLKSKIITGMLVFLLVIPLPFYLNGINKYFIPNENAVYHGIVKIPEEYLDLKNIINKSKGSKTLLSLPSSINVSVNWSNYDKWHFAGADVISTFYNNDFISANSFDSLMYSKLSFWDYVVKNNIDEKEFLDLAQRYGVRYVMLHKDIPTHYINASKIIYETAELLNKQGVLKKITENEYFTFFELVDGYVLPVIHSESNEIYFKRNSPVSYTIEIKNLSDKCELYYNKTYSDCWNIYLSGYENEFADVKFNYPSFDSTEFESKEAEFDINNLKTIFLKNIFEESHSLQNHYANGWIIDKDYIVDNFPEGSYKLNEDGSINVQIILSNKIQLFFYLGLLVTLITIILIILSYIIKVKSVKNKKQSEK